MIPFVFLKTRENTQAARQIWFTNVREIVEMESILKAYIYEAIEVEKAGLEVNFKKTILQNHATENPKSQKKKMKQQTKSTVPLWYWVIAAVALLWNLLGCAFFGMELFAQEAVMESMTEPQKEWARSIPGWIYFVYGLAVSTGVAGSIGLCLRKGWTTLMFAICLVAVIVQMVYTMIIGGLQVIGPSGLVMPSLVIGIAAALLWFSWFARSRGWFGQVSPTVERE